MKNKKKKKDKKSFFALDGTFCTVVVPAIVASIATIILQVIIELWKVYH